MLRDQVIRKCRENSMLMPSENFCDLCNDWQLLETSIACNMLTSLGFFIRGLMTKVYCSGW